MRNKWFALILVTVLSATIVSPLAAAEAPATERAFSVERLFTQIVHWLGFAPPERNDAPALEVTARSTGDGDDEEHPPVYQRENWLVDPSG